MSRNAIFACWDAASRLGCLGVMLIAASVPASHLLAEPAPPSTAAPTQPAKLPVPDSSVQAKSLALIKDLYRDDYAKGSLAGRKALAGKLVFAAEGLKGDPAGQYVLLSEARRLAISAGSPATALRAVELTVANFAVDETELKLGTLTALGRSEVSSADAQLLAEQWLEVCHNDLAVRDFSGAARALAQADTWAERVRDPKFAKAQTGKSEKPREVLNEYKRTKLAFDALAGNPTDPVACQAVGTFDCFAAEDWETGLPLLVRGRDQAIAELAKADLNTADTPEAQVKTGDGWWDWAESQRPAWKASARSRACGWYALAEPKLTGLMASRIRMRMAAVRGPLIDLLAMARIPGGVVAGTFERSGDGVRSGTESLCVLELPYEPPPEYDVELEFTRVSGSEHVGVVLTNGRCSFAWLMGERNGTGCEFWGFRPAKPHAPPTVLKLDAPLVDGRRYACRIQVRNDGVSASVDGKLIASLKTDQFDLVASNNWHLHTQTILGLTSNSTSAIFHSAELVEITKSAKP